MAEKLDPNETVSMKELTLSNMYVQEALVNLLVRKGILTKEEVLEELKAVKRQYPV